MSTEDITRSNISQQPAPRQSQSSIETGLARALASCCCCLPVAAAVAEVVVVAVVAELKCSLVAEEPC